MAAETTRPVRGILVAALPGAAVGALALWAEARSAWPLLGEQPLGRTFGDLRAVTAAAGCAARPGWSVRSPTCDPFHRPYNYPTVWARVGAFFGVNPGSTDAIGIALIVLFALTVVVLGVVARSSDRPVLGPVAMLLAAVGPPSLFALERGNIDIVVFAVVVAGIVSSVRGAPTLAAVLFGLAVPLKIYPLGATPALLLDRPRRRRPLIVFAVVALGGLALTAPELPFIAAGTPQYAPGSFGASVLPIFLDKWLGHLHSPVVERAAGLLLFTAGTLVALWATRPGAGSRFAAGWRRFLDTVRADTTAAVLVAAGGGCVLVAYIVGTSFDYRLIFLIPVVAGLARIRPGAARATVPAIVLTLLLMYITYPTNRFQYAGDGLWLLLAPLLAVLLFDLSGLRRTSAPSPAEARRSREPRPTRRRPALRRAG